MLLLLLLIVFDYKELLESLALVLSGVASGKVTVVVVAAAARCGLS